MSTDESWEPLPTYFEVINGNYEYTKLIISTWPEPSFDFFLKSFINFFTYLKISKSDIFILFTLTVLWTVLRNFLTNRVFKPLGKYYALTASSQSKMPESAWKLLYYSIIWSTTLYIIVLKGSYHFFQKPSEVWQEWDFEEPAPLDIYLIYMVQCSFYLHSIYATLVLDTWRKDSPVMLAHHLITLALILLSYGLRYHKTGSLILLLHDVCDIQLEVAKLNVYFKVQGGRLVQSAETRANLAFLLFSVTWYLTRLYWYPLKALHTNGTVLLRKNLLLPYGLLMNSLLWALQILHIYWFSMILDFLWRVYSGQLEDLADVREYDVATSNSVQKSSKEAECTTNGVSTLNGNKKFEQNCSTAAPLATANGVSHRHVAS